VEQWKARDPQKVSDRKMNNFFVSTAEIREKAYDLSFNRYSETKPDETIYEEPKVILQQLKVIEAKIQQGIEELEGIFG
jgi:type I restriction enzyme M protein